MNDHTITLTTKDIPYNHRECTRCKGVKTVDNFKTRAKGGYYKYCNDCNHEVTRLRVSHGSKGTGCMKYCNGCKTWKFRVYFTPKSRKNHGAGYDAHYAYCTTCQKRKQTIYDLQLKRNGIKYKAMMFKARLVKFKITEKEYVRIYNDQGGKCAICGVPELELSRSLSIDHCHDTGVIRGLLCDKCNKGIGLLGDDYDGVMRAVDYLSNVEGRVYNQRRNILFKNTRL